MLILASDMLHQLLKDPDKSMWSSYLRLKRWALSVISAYKAHKVWEVGFSSWWYESFSFL